MVYAGGPGSVPNGGAGPDPTLQRPDPVVVAGAQQALAAGKLLTPEQSQALIQDTVVSTRQRLVQPGQALSADGVNGLCGAASDLVAQGLTDQGVPASDVQLHQVADTFPDAGLRHTFTTVQMPGGGTYLIDPTFRQFTPSNTQVNGAGGPAQFLYGTPQGSTVANELLTKGYVKLDDQTARLYGQAFDPQHRPVAVTVQDIERTPAPSDYDRAELSQFFPESRLVH
jgi:hypothetical protein